MPQPPSERTPGGPYDPSGRRPLRSYTTLTLAFATLAASGFAALSATGRTPARPSLRDSIRLGIATHKLARMIAKDKVTAPYRAPFTRFETTEGTAPAEVAETVRGEGLRRAIGELLTCPYCLAPWIATGLLYGSEAAPRPTHTAISVLEAVTVSDFLQILYKGADEKLL